MPKHAYGSSVVDTARRYPPSKESYKDAASRRCSGAYSQDTSLKGVRGDKIHVQDSNATYADNFHFAWTINSAAEFVKAYEAARRVCQTHLMRGLQVSADKIVILLDIRGKRAKKSLRRHMVKTSQVRCFKCGDQCLDLKTVTSHVYLAAKISYRKFEMDTAQHRVQLARGNIAGNWPEPTTVVSKPFCDAKRCHSSFAFNCGEVAYRHAYYMRWAAQELRMS